MQPDEILDAPSQVAATIARLYRRGLTTSSGGNVSVRDDDGAVWITPAGVDKAAVGPRDIVGLDGSPEGRHRPSTESALHRHVYEKHRDVRAIVHAHPAGLVAFSVCHRVPDIRVLPLAASICGPVGYAPYETAGTDRLGRVAADAFAGETSCVVLENHGVVVAAGTAWEAFRRLETLEFAARTIAAAGSLGAIRDPGPDIDTSRVRSVGSLEPSAEHRSRREEICAIARRVYDRRLTASAGASISARIDAETFLITPHDFDPEAPEPSALLRLRSGGPAAPLHAAIYAARPEVGAVIDAAPVCATAFSLTDTPLDTRIMAESYLLLGDVPTDAHDSSPITSPDARAALLANRGVLVAGSTLFEAFDRLEVFEATAAALITASAVGEPVPIPIPPT